MILRDVFMDDMCIYECYGMFQDSYEQITNAFYMCLPRIALTYNTFKAERSG